VNDELPLLLLVDDSEAILALEKAALGNTYRLLTASNGRLALDEMAKTVPHGVVLDLSMPVMDGDEVLKAMKLDPRLAEVPVLVVSTESQRARDTLSLGADDFLPKPVTLEDLRRRVAAMLEAASSRQASRLLPYLFFRAASQELALGLDAVAVVAPRPALRPLPGAPAHIPGYFELYGEPVPVLDLAARLGLQAEKPVNERKVVVAKIGALKLGIEADEVWDPEGLDAAALTPVERLATKYEGLKGRLLGLARGSRGLAPVLATEALLEEAELGLLAEALKKTGAAVKAA
jgi:CheY-like chemotaxis protein